VSGRKPGQIESPISRPGAANPGVRGAIVLVTEWRLLHEQRETESRTRDASFVLRVEEIKHN